MYKTMRLCCSKWFTKNEEVNIVRSDIQKERDCRGVDAWSEDYFQEQQIEPLKDLYDRFLIEIRIAQDIQKGERSDVKKFDHILK